MYSGFPGSFLGSFLAGTLWFTLFGEYLLHRFLFHGKFSGLRLPPVVEHKKHHLGPFFAPWWIKLWIVTPLMLVLTSVIANFILPLHAVGFAVGVTLSYVFLELLHFSLHSSPPATRFG